MPRTPPALFRKAKRYSPHVATLLLACRDVPSAVNEYRWIKDHVESTVAQPFRRSRIAELCRKRGNGVPLQYVLGSQPFGPLDIRCKRGVLIPRPETEAYTYHVANLVKTSEWSRELSRNRKDALKVLDLCSGTGCIPLLLFSLLRGNFPKLAVHGVDVSPIAIGVAEENVRHNVKLGYMQEATADQSVDFSLRNILDNDDMLPLTAQPWDIIISNPPYISRKVWSHGAGQLGYSVRKYEPELALVPSPGVAVPPNWAHADVFYATLFELASIIQPRLLVTELGDLEQAQRVLKNFFSVGICNDFNVEVWRDFPDMHQDDITKETLFIPTLNKGSQTVHIKGTGHIRCIALSRKD